jgi:hypothetical protein
MSVYLSDHIDRGVGGRQHGASEDIERAPRQEQYFDWQI